MVSAGKKSLLTCGQFSSAARVVRKLAAPSLGEWGGGLWARASPVLWGVGGVRPDEVRRSGEPRPDSGPRPATQPLQALPAFASQELNFPAFWFFLKYSLILPDAREAFLAFLPPGNLLAGFQGASLLQSIPGGTQPHLLC